MSNRMRRQQPSMRAAAAARAAEEEAAAERAARRRRVIVGVGIGVAALAVVVLGALALTRGGESQQVAVDPLARELGCSSCHTPDGARSEGPTWEGLAGSERTLEDGTTIVADRDYLRRAITDPQAEVVAGFSPMPVVSVDDADVEALVDYIESLG